MVSVIIPALNEEERIADVIRHARASVLVSEVIVVDDGSTDATFETAVSAGAKVITSTLLGKGASIEDGLRVASGDILLFLDGDLSGLCDDLEERLCRPLLKGDADFVKARFQRAAGRVTTLTAKPMLQTFFPELAGLSQPLGGVYAVKRVLLDQLRLETDYGVDIGLLIDAHMLGAKVMEVDIGYLDHDSHPLEDLGDMARQVMRTILHRADKYGRLSANHVREVEEDERHEEPELKRFLETLGGSDAIALIDMDGTLVQGRFVRHLAERVERESQLFRWLDNPAVSDAERSRRIAEVFAGVPKAVFQEVARQMPLIDGAAQAVVDLKRMGYRVGIVSDSFRIATEVVRRRVFADFSVAHLLRFTGGRATGELTISPLLVDPEGCRQHEVCKSNLLLHLWQKVGVSPFATVAVGDGPEDECMLRAVGTSVAFEPKVPWVAKAATHRLEGSLQGLAELLPRVEWWAAAARM
ncbi:MAG: glycosyltransferase [Bryobacterales bacterium]|nr:glycosyltransferase [Bryobacterales bacterium]